MTLRARLGLGAALLAVIAAAFCFKGRRPETRYTTAAVERGDVVVTVGATGTLQAVVTVQVGSQVSGIIQDLRADFNSVVKKGEVIARLDPSSFEARAAQSRANLVAAQANVEKVQATIADMRQKYDRAKQLSAEQLLPATDLETARTNYEGALAQLQAARAAVTQARAALQQAEVDLRHTVIEAPIDGVVIARSVDVGQTVAASLQAPVLFVIANDLSQMQVNASVDEADVGKLQAGQDVTFHVDAYPEQEFTGRLTQVRLQPTTNQNVVTYNTIISVPNRDLRLMPGMTASVSIVTERREDVLRIPAAALRFRPAERAAEPSSPGGERSGRESARIPGQARARTTTVYVEGDQGPEPVSVVAGASDGQFVEIKEGLTEGARVITGAGGPMGAWARPTAGAGSNPFSPPQFQRRQR